MFLLREQCPRAELEIIAQCHPWEYIERIRGAVPEVGLVQLNDDTVLSAGRFEASLHAAGGAILAVDEVMAARAKNAFVAIRPAGHHAATTTAMGFCLFNNAIAVRHAQRRYGAERAAIVDFDAHHGNGSQQIFWSDRTVMYCSTHQMPLFPGTGSICERGEYDNIVNAPLRAGDGGEAFREASRSRFFAGFKNSGLTSSSSQLVSTHTSSAPWQISISWRRISAGRPTGSWRSLI
jgi:acetoin utilization deacetylase AcuC-like enzyme